MKLLNSGSRIKDILDHYILNSMCLTSLEVYTNVLIYRINGFVLFQI